MKNIIFVLIFLCITVSLPCQEILKSSEEEYYDFLALHGKADRPTLNYRTLSDSTWNINPNFSHPWQFNSSNSLYPLFGKFFARIYGPELFISANTTAPYGYNDGVLWQGKGINTSLSSGIRIEGHGIEFTVLPRLAFSQNLDYKIMPSSYENEYGYFWGYGWGYGVDAPQRFGDKPFFDWDFGDSEIRYTWKNLTAGFGTQSIWLGPSYRNPILHSNNASSYPKFDIGLRRQSIRLPRLNRFIGDIEARLWIGRLSESDYFDTNESNDHTMFHGLSLAYAPSFLTGLTLFANRVCLVPWEFENLKFIIPSAANTYEDQKMSFGFSWLFSKVGFEVYGEVGLDDYSAGGILGYIRHPFHTTAYTAGLKKIIEIKPLKNIYGEIIFEFSWMEMTQDFQLQWPYSFYFHHNLKHGYTNKGQWLGNSVSPGGNSQYLSFILYYPKGNSSLFISRNNPDSNFIYKNAIYAAAGANDNELSKKYFRKNKANFLIGINTSYFITTNISLSGGVVYNPIINPQYFYDNKKDNEGKDTYQQNTYMHNFSFQFGIKFIL